MNAIKKITSVAVCAVALAALPTTAYPYQAFVSAATATAETIAEKPAIPIKVSVLQGDGAENAFRTKSRILLDPKGYKLDEGLGYNVKFTIPGDLYQNQQLLSAAVYSARERSEEVYGKLGFEDIKMVKALFVDINEDQSAYSATILLSLTDAKTKKEKIVPAAVFGTKLASGNIMDSLGMQETLDLYLDSLDSVHIEAPIPTDPPPEETPEPIPTQEPDQPTQDTPPVADDTDHYEGAPVFSAIINPSTYVGNTPNYLSFANVSYGGDSVDVTCDSSAVNIKKAGRYKITYKAVGSNGKEASASAFLSVSKTNPSTVMEAADKILKQITNSNMTKKQKARAIFDWVKKNIKYTGSSDKTDSITGAYNAFRNRKGDCFAYYAASEILLSRVGIENLRINRSMPPGVTEHYWNLVYLDGIWRHFDTTPFSVKGSWETFLFSESIAQKLTKERGRSCYIYNAALYPKVVWD
ncbi:MAG: hypothetical protein LBT59_20205 [Clostridiales bacterium]|jgi:transglutaminase-like putative cysteine protease|nr:hypothetical protein [Clostridiales bacterium]